MAGDQQPQGGQDRRDPYEQQRRIDRLIGLVEGQSQVIQHVADQQKDVATTTGQIALRLGLIEEKVERATHVLFEDNGHESLVVTVRELKRCTVQMQMRLDDADAAAKVAAAEDRRGSWQARTAAITGILTLMGAVGVALLT